MTIDPRLLRNHSEAERVNYAVEKLYRSTGRLKARHNLSKPEACRIVNLAWRNAKILPLEYDLRSDWDGGRPRIDWAEHSKKMQLEALKLAKSYEAFLKTIDRTAGSHDHEIMVFPLMLHKQCGKGKARESANSLIQGLEEVKAISQTKLPPFSNGRLDAPRVDLRELAYVWVDLFGRKPGTSNAGGPFLSFLNDVLGDPRKCPKNSRTRSAKRQSKRHQRTISELRDLSRPIKAAVANMDADAVRFIKDNGYCLWRKELGKS